MTNKEAIEDIKNNILPFVGGKSLVMAIKALEEQERPTGKYTYADGYLQGYIDGSTGTDWRMIEE